MKNKIISILLCLTLLTSCGSVKSVKDKKSIDKEEVVSGENDPLMKLLISALIIYSINILVAR